MAPRSLLAVFAHPDDETFGGGGLLARYAAEGVRVSMVCATRGEVGEISDPSLATRENLGEVRERELRDACRVLGIEEPIILGYRDSGMAGTSDNANPRAFSQADQEEVVEKVVEIIRREQPDVVVTFDPNGGYGHPDHIRIHQATLEAFSAAGDPARFPHQISFGLAPHQPVRLYYVAFPRSMTRDLIDAMKAADIQSDFTTMDPEQFGVPDEELTTVLDVGAYAEIKERAARCHRTQIEGDQFFPWLPPALRQRFLSTEYLIRAEPPFSHGRDATEVDLF